MTSPSRTQLPDRTPSPLMISVAGIRGVVGESLTPPVIARFAAAFAHELGEGPVVVGRDARSCGAMVLRAVISPWLPVSDQEANPHSLTRMRGSAAASSARKVDCLR